MPTGCPRLLGISFQEVLSSCAHATRRQLVGELGTASPLERALLSFGEGKLGHLAQIIGRRGLGRVRLVGENVRAKGCLTQRTSYVFLVFHSENKES